MNDEVMNAELWILNGAGIGLHARNWIPSSVTTTKQTVLALEYF
jgi:hypothetical protein